MVTADMDRFKIQIRRQDHHKEEFRFNSNTLHKNKGEKFHPKRKMMDLYHSNYPLVNGKKTTVKSCQKRQNINRNLISQIQPNLHKMKDAQNTTKFGTKFVEVKMIE